MSRALRLRMPTSSLPVAIVTGAGSGIGRSTAQMLSELGYCVVLVGRRLDALERTAGMIKGESIGVAADIAEPGSAAEIVRSTIERFGRIDVLVNNAGYAPLCEIDKCTPELLEHVYGVNAVGPAMLTAAVWPLMVAARRGCVVYVSTLGTHDPFPGFFAYASAKAAVNVMARMCAREGKQHGIRSFSVAPGAVETEMLRSIFPESRVPKAAALQSDEVARLIVDCIIGKYDARNGDTIFITVQKGIQ